MNQIDYILDNEIFLEKLESNLLSKYEENSTGIQTLLQLSNLYRQKGNLEQSKHYCLELLHLEPEHVYANQLKAALSGQFDLSYCTADQVAPSPFIVIDDFIANEKLLELESIIKENSDLFDSTRVNYKGKNIKDDVARKSKVLDKKHFKQFAHFFESKLLEVVPSVAYKLKLRPSILHPELSLTMHLDGDFFKIHSDVLAKGKGSLRALTFVFYYHKNPKAFNGGDLLLFDSSTNRGQHDMNYTKISPVRNSIIFFPSGCYHKVTPIKLNTTNYLNGRFTINGWFHKNAEAL